VRFEVLIAMKVSMLFWVVTPWNTQVGTNVSVKHIVSIFRTEGYYVSPKRWYLPTSLNGVTTKNKNIVIFTAVRKSDL